MAIRYFFILALTFSTTILFSQDFSTDYVVLKNTGVIPKDLLSSSSQKYRQRKETISKKDSRRTKKIKDKFYLESSFVIDELLHSGKILFSDKEITNYINSVADELLKADPALRKKLRFYTIKSSTANAFATDRGAIFFTLGLLSKLNSESELAFILSHEIAHYTEKHSLNAAVTFDKINRKGKRRKRKIVYNDSKSYDPLIKKSNYSKKNEEEADLLGGKRFLKTNYNPNAMLGVFDILEFSHLPLNNDSINPSFLNLDDLTLPKEYFLTSLEAPSSMEDDEYSTHPGVDKRREKAKKLLTTSQKSGKDFIVSKRLFQLAKTTAQFELCDVLLQEMQYPDAIYYSSVLLQKYPNNRFLKRTKAFALYGLAQYINADREIEVLKDYRDMQGHASQVYHVIEELASDLANINLVASRYCWDYHEAYPEDKGMTLALQDQVEDMVIYALEEANGYFAKRKFKNPNIEKDFALLAFAKIRLEEAFKKMLRDGARYKKKFEEEKENPKKKKDKKVALGIKKAVFINPVYYRVDRKRRSNNELKYIYSEDRQKEFVKVIKRNAKRVNLKVKVIDGQSFKSNKDLENFNDLMLFTNFKEELLSHNMYMIVSSYNRVQPLVKKYKTASIVTTGNFSIKAKPTVISYPLSILLSMPPFTTRGYKRMFDNYQGFQYSFVFNIEDNRILYKSFVPYKQKDITAMLEMNTYNLLYKLKAKKKK